MFTNYIYFINMETGKKAFIIFIIELKIIHDGIIRIQNNFVSVLKSYNVL